MFTAKQKVKVESLEARFDKVCLKIEEIENRIRDLEEAGKGDSAKCESLQEKLFDLENDQYDIQTMIEEIYEEAGEVYA